MIAFPSIADEIELGGDMRRSNQFRDTDRDRRCESKISSELIA